MNKNTHKVLAKRAVTGHFVKQNSAERKTEEAKKFAAKFYKQYGEAMSTLAHE